MKQFLLLAIMGLLSGCATTTDLQRMPFPENEYQALPKTGTATVKGQAFMKTRGGDVKTAAGNEVWLNPVTSYSIEWYEKFYLPTISNTSPLRDIKTTPPDPRLTKYILIQIADGDGRFTFKNAPPGEYFVTTAVTWYVGKELQGGFVTKRITVKDGEETDVIVTR